MRFGPRRSVAPAWAVDFSAATAGAYSAAALLALGSGGLVLTRSTAVASVQTSSATVDSSPGVDVPRIQYDGTVRGLLIEETRTNYCLASRASNTAPWSIDATVTANVDGGPDGSVGTLADRINTLSGHAGTHQGVTATGTDQVWSVWCRAASTTFTNQILIGTGGAGSKCASFAGVDTTWRRQSVYGTPATKHGYACEGENLTSISGGIAAGARDCYIDMAQYEIGKFPTSFIFTTAAAAVTRAGERLRHDKPTAILVAGRLSLAFAFYPLGASTEYLANMRLWTIDASNYAEVDFTTRVVSVVVGGVTVTLGALPTWNRLNLLEVWIESGGGISATLAKARVNGGSVTDLGTGAAQAAIVPGANALEFLCSGTANQLSAAVKSLSNVKPAYA